MTHSSIASISGASPLTRGTEWLETSHLRLASALAAVLAVALVLRLAFFTGYMGSDEVVYTEGAVRLLHGESVRSTYIGQLRYGVDMPVAFFIWLLGPGLASAAGWAMLTSVIDVGLIFGCAFILWGLRAAIFSGLVCAFLPIHVHLAGRLLADPPLAAFMTLSFFCFLMGNRRNSPIWFLCTGLAVGAVFWVKQAAILYVIAFPALALIRRMWNWKWLWGAIGALLMLAMNCAVMWKLQGDPLHVFRVSGQGLDEYGGRTDIDDSVWLYFRYLFLDLRHTWILGYLAAASVVLAFVLPRWATARRLLAYPAIWAVSLVGIFSFAVISFDPLRFVMKQSNYMLLFTAPLCLLAGYMVSRLRPASGIALTLVYALGGTVLAALMQQDVHIFRANSASATAFARSNPKLDVYATTNAYRLALFENALSVDRKEGVTLKGLEALKSAIEGAAVSGTMPSQRRIAIVDTQNLHWGRDPISSIEELPSCWRRLGELPRTEPTGPGSYIVGALLKVSAALPERIGERVDVRLQALQRSKPAYVYEVPAGCGLKDSLPAKKDARSNGQ
jgi:hypothetical protein